MAAKDTATIVISLLALALSSVTAYFQFGKWKDFRFSYQLTVPPTIQLDPSSTPPKLQVRLGEQTLVFINNGSDPVAILGINMLLLNNGPKENIQEPANNIKLSSCQEAPRGGTYIYSFGFTPTIVSAKLISKVDVQFDRAPIDVSSSWNNDSELVGCYEFNLVDRDGQHTVRSRFERFGSKGGSPLDASEVPEKSASVYTLLSEHFSLFY